MRKLFNIVFPAVLLLIGSAQLTWAQKAQFYDLGHYPGGTWAEPRGISEAGIVVGFGDIASGYTRPIGVPLFGRDAGQWFDLGTLGGERTDTEVMCMGIAQTGMIVGHAAIPDTTVHAFAWTKKFGMVDIGTLADDSNFKGYTWSLAYNVNKSGTLIVGWGSTEWMGRSSLPVVWTREVPARHETAITWKIQKLDTTGFEQFHWWYATAVNNYGQIIGTAANDDGVGIAVLWNPVPGKEGWEIMQLPVPGNYPNAAPSDLNDRGEIVGYLAAPDWSTWFPALWKPVGHQRSAYDVTWLPALASWGGAEASGINDEGDIVGDSYDANGNDVATRWSTRNLTFIEALSFPGTWSWAGAVNNDGIVTGSYGSDTIAENTVIWKLR
jgi:probable HAF family extracellular repeat protein